MNSRDERFFVLHANCIPVKGANRSVICDLHLNRLRLIPNDLFKILTTHESKRLSEIKKSYNNEFDDTIDEYFEFLKDAGFGFYSDTPDRFPRLNPQWASASEITNSIIDVDENSDFDIIDIIKQLDGLNCKHLQIRFYFTPELSVLREINQYLESIQSGIVSIEAILKFDEGIEAKEYEKLLQYPRFFSVSLYSAPNDKTIALPENKRIILLKQPINSHLHCGNISTEYFSVNIKNFTESLQFNSCLNKKLSVDSKGQIKNCPSMNQSFGSVGKTRIEEALRHKDFSRYWTMTKDQISICKECEFRYVCTDCRAFVENQENDVSKPLKCGYDPKTNEWNEWSLNPLKQEAIAFYGMQDLVKSDG